MSEVVVTVTPDSSIGVAIVLMSEGGFRRLPVVEDGRLIGIVTDRDLRQATNSPLVLRERWYSDFLLDAIKVKSCMTPNPITVARTTPVLDVVRLLRQHKIGGLPVVENGAVVGIVTTTDVLDYLIVLLEREQGEGSAEQQPL
ncbi:MAG: CBS domain-containing protein [Caldilineae bacterium]|nr:CBS domain-containing protein [Anaerolineae bacterium]MCB0198769.1 CBS domain-containing protein [Anaerolineae bacterium]MCB0203436.1 CBS domain-containing protein [Anaerolineae bacterium]MCB0255931.1 CBS domain-containing protein [Anaerolineae bacterium]MCB9154309.1 CBS domain-containing protein [Caldilineae bacterium]